MNCFTNYGRAILLTSALGVPGLAFAGDLDELTAKCDSCHGPQGASSFSDMPIIGGQSAGYIADSLESFQDWGRPCVKSRYRYGDTSRPKTDMCKITAGLSNEDFAALTAHYSTLPFVAAKQEFDAAQVEAGAALQAQHCESCHQQGGTSLEGRGPRLAGQWTPYLKATLKYVPTGEHLVPHAMETLLTDLTDEDLDAILSFYASQQN
jgi:sulfide dehydrogenase cytochrome subunit